MPTSAWPALAVFGLGLAAGGVQAWADYDAGLDAWRRGDAAGACAEWEAAAGTGDARAALALGERYDLGEGRPQDPDRAAAFYRQAAEQGLPAAEFNLAVMFDSGRGVKQDRTEAAIWYRRAAEQGFARAQYNLGLLYRDGEGVERDLNEARRWFAAAAGQHLDAARVKIAALGNPQPPERRVAALEEAVEVRLRPDHGALDIVWHRDAKTADLQYYFDLVRFDRDHWVRLAQQPIDRASSAVPLRPEAGSYAWRILVVKVASRRVARSGSWNYLSVPGAAGGETTP